MDIRLRTSILLLAIRMCIFSLAVLSILASELCYILKLLLSSAASLQFFIVVLNEELKAGLFIPGGDCSADKNSERKIVLELRDQRRIELTLVCFYSLSWVQVLYLTSARTSSVLLVMPDTCSADERRFLRKFLNPLC